MSNRNRAPKRTCFYPIGRKKEQHKRGKRTMKKKTTTTRTYSDIPLIQSQCSRIQRHLFKINVPTHDATEMELIGNPTGTFPWDKFNENPFENLMDECDLDDAINSLREIRGLATYLEEKLSDERLFLHTCQG